MAADNFIAGLYDDLTAIIGATWPEVTVIWKAEELNLTTYANAVAPYAVIEIGDLMRVPNWGVGNNLFQRDVDIYYVAPIGDGLLATLQSKLVAIMQPLWASNFLETGSQVTGITDISWSDSLVPNQFFASKKNDHRAGLITATILIPMRLQYPAPPTE